MFLTSLTLEDYGAYAGTNSFDLSCSREKPVVLIGGSNGAGKTTLFGSIPLCLYGIGSMGKCTVGSYRKDLARRIHRGVSAGRSSITVQFLLSHNGRMTEYRVRRSWGTGGKESLDIGLARSGRQGLCVTQHGQVGTAVIHRQDCSDGHNGAVFPGR